MRTLDLDALGDFLSKREDIAFAVVFGSAAGGEVRDGSDLDLGIFFTEKPGSEELIDLLTDVADLLAFDRIDLTDLSKADPILAFEALSGRFLCKNDRAKTAEFSSLTSRLYEDVMVRLKT